MSKRCWCALVCLWLALTSRLVLAAPAPAPLLIDATPLLGHSTPAGEGWFSYAIRLQSVSKAELRGFEGTARHDEIDRRISQRLADADPQQLMELLEARGIAGGRVLNTVDIHDDPHLNARGFWVELPHPKMHAWKQPRSAWQLREARPIPKRHAPLFGEHNDEILRGLLGLSDAEMAELEAALVISGAPVNPGVG